ncbi:unnamed protein product [Amoebophrya sp. A25]|nr:unnamed protein product [Amoebophrya sp. A25]|eukprot:GSA25T00013095001.1
MTSILEQTRSAHEALEHLEKSMSIVLQERSESSVPKAQVACESRLRYLLEEMQKHAQQALDLYEDKDNMRAEECDKIAGVDTQKPDATVWNAFYDRVKEVKNYHRKNPIEKTRIETTDPHWYVTRAKEIDDTDAKFSAEEAFGKRLDLHAHYLRFINMKKYRDIRAKRHTEMMLARLRRKNPDKDVDVTDPKVQEEIKFTEVDYVKWLQSLHEFWECPRHCKYREAGYTEYVKLLAEYLQEFIQRSQPLQNMDQILKQFDEEFEEQWENGQRRGWEEPTCKMDLYVRATDRLFSNANTKAGHEKSKAYKKRMNEMSSWGPGDIASIESDSWKEDTKVARLEALCQKFLDLVQDQLRETVNVCELKQAMTPEEYEEHQEEVEREQADEAAANAAAMSVEDDVDSDDEKGDEDRAIYNPLKLPVGWDGKPIPYWLYKLHDMGREYKCEICGNHSYWGPRAFHQHFSEWRHAQGMRALKIPNTRHFREVTKIVDAVSLWEKLNKEATLTEFNQDTIECEDAQGNVMSKRAFEDLRKQGLV